VAEIRAAEGVENNLFKAIRQHGAVRELPLTVATLRVFSEGKIRITRDRRVVDTAGRVIKGYDLTGEIDEKVRGKP
jgi:phosphoribosylglycinamide formyltransferase-1